MDNIQKKSSRKNMLTAFAVNIIIMAVILLLTDVVYETNDDFALACRIADGEPYLIFVNYFLCVPLAALQSVVTGVNIFVTVQMAAAFLCFTAVTKIMLDKGRGLLFNTATVMIIGMLAFDHYGMIQFTKTSALLTISGMMILADSMLNRRHLGYYIFAIIMVYMGAAFRIYSLAAAVGFAGLYLIFELIYERKKLADAGLFKPKQIGKYCLIFIILCGTMLMHTASMNMVNSDPERSEYNSYNDARSNVVDYPVYSSFIENPEKYKHTGLSENDVYLISHWYLDDEGAAAEKNLLALRETYTDLEQGESKAPAEVVKEFVKGTISDITEHSRRGSHIIIMVLMALTAVVFMRPKYLPFVLAAGASAAVLYMMLYYMGRPAYRATYMADAGCILWLLYYMKPEYFRRAGGSRRDRNNLLSLKAATAAATVITVIICCGLSVPMYKADIAKAAETEGRIISSELLEYTEAQENTLFICDISVKRSAPEYADALSYPQTVNNIMGTGSWGTHSPYIQEKFRGFGVTNCYGDAIDSDRIRFVANSNIDRLEEYFNKWYGEEGSEIHMKETGTAGGYSIWQAVREVK